MKILMITTNDPAGVGINFTNAINRYTPHQCRLITTEIRYNFYYQKDLHLPWLEDLEEVEYLLKHSEILHLHMGVTEETRLGPFKVGDFLKGKKVVHHHHGEPPFRANPLQYYIHHRIRKRQTIVSTPDLLRIMPEATWIPNPVPIFDIEYLPKASENGRVEVWVAHSPTRRELKNTQEFIQVMDSLQGRYPFVRPVMIENTQHTQCLRLKRGCDILFDHMQGYYGVSSLEGLSMGIPVIAGIDEWCRRKLLEFTGAPDIPWVIARDKEMLEQQLEHLVLDPDWRRQLGRSSREWMESYWTESRIANALIDFYLG
jgi:glycosyltransferase involved in cell wall biosynthesis